MKLLALCLLAVCCFTLVAPAPLDNSFKRKLKETLDELTKFNRSLTSMERMEKRVNTPPENIEGCGCLSALKCFQEGVSTFNATTQQIKLYRSLGNPFTKNGLQFCARDSAPSCSECKTHPVQSVEDFLKQLESLLQMGISKLSMD